MSAPGRVPSERSAGFRLPRPPAPAASASASAAATSAAAAAAAAAAASAAPAPPPPAPSLLARLCVDSRPLFVSVVLLLLFLSAGDVEEPGDRRLVAAGAPALSGAPSSSAASHALPGGAPSSPADFDVKDALLLELGLANEALAGQNARLRAEVLAARRAARAAGALLPPASAELLAGTGAAGAASAGALGAEAQRVLGGDDKIAAPGGSEDSGADAKAVPPPTVPVAAAARGADGDGEGEGPSVGRPRPRRALLPPGRRARWRT